MAEPIYLNYGSNAQIDLNEFLNAASNNLESYLAELPWSNKRKDLFKKAYVDIMSRGVVGAENTTGIWNVLHNGNLIDLNSLPKKEREMYGEAAYYIQLLMSKTPTKLEREEEEKKRKESLPVFNNEYFTKQFQGYIGNNMFGGIDWDVNDNWNTLDPSNSDGLRNTTNRTKKLADMIEGYVNSVKEDEVNFEGGPFKDYNDFKQRAANAIAALRTSDPSDDEQALYGIGIKASDYLSTGADDMVDYHGLTMTRSEALDKINEELEAKQQQSQQQSLETTSLQQQAALIKRIFSTKTSLYGQTPEYLAEKFKTDSGIIEGINKILNDAGGPDGISSHQWSELLGAYKFYNKNGRLEDISPEELALFLKTKDYSGVSSGVLKKLPGVEGVYFDTKTNLVIIPSGIDGTEAPVGTADLLSSQGKDAKQKEYMSRKASTPSEFTSSEWLEITSVVTDIASIIDPEPISAAVLGFGAAALRNVAKAKQPGSWGLGDYLGQIGDYVTGVLGAVPLLGDGILVAKALRSLKNIAMFPIVYNLWSNTPKVAGIFKNKILGDESMTAQDWLDIAEFFRDLIGGGLIRKSNLAERKVLLERGVKLDTKPSGIIQKGDNWLLKHGLLTTRPLKGSGGSSVKVKIDGKETEVKLSKESADKIRSNDDFKTNNKEARNKAISEIKEVKAAREKVANESGKKVEDVSVEIGTRWRARNLPGVRSIAGTSKYSVKDNKRVFLRDASKDNFDKWLESRTGIKSWRNSLYEAIDRQFRKLGYYDVTTPPPPTSRPIKDPLTMPVYRDARMYRNAINNANNPRGALKAIKPGSTGEITINGKRIEFLYIKNNGKDYLQIKRGDLILKKLLDKDAPSLKAKQLVAKTIEDARMEGRRAARSSKQANDQKMSDLVKSVKDLKRQGFLRKGGTLDNRDVNIIISEFLNKLK